VGIIKGSYASCWFSEESKLFQPKRVRRLINLSRQVHHETYNLSLKWLLIAIINLSAHSYLLLRGTVRRSLLYVVTATVDLIRWGSLFVLQDLILL